MHDLAKTKPENKTMNTVIYRVILRGGEERGRIEIDGDGKAVIIGDVPPAQIIEVCSRNGLKTREVNLNRAIMEKVRVRLAIETILPRDTDRAARDIVETLSLSSRLIRVEDRIEVYEAARRKLDALLNQESDFAEVREKRAAEAARIARGITSKDYGEGFDLFADDLMEQYPED